MLLPGYEASFPGHRECYPGCKASSRGYHETSIHGHFGIGPSWPGTGTPGTMGPLTGEYGKARNVDFEGVVMVERPKMA